MGFLPLSRPTVPAWFVVEREAILRDARRLKERAAFLCMEEEVARIIAPCVKRIRGRQKGSHSRKLADRRERLWQDFKAEMAASPGTMEEIAARLFARGRTTYGNSVSAIVSQIAAIKAARNSQSLLQAALRPKKRGRPKNGR